MPFYFKLSIIILNFLLSSNLVESTSDAEYTKEETEALKNFRPLIENILTQDYQKKDSYLIRWLRAKKLNLNEARQFLSAAQEWRKLNDLDSIVNETILEGFPFPVNFDTHDNDGRTVHIFKFGLMDLRRVLLNGKKKELGRKRLQTFEIILNKSINNSNKSTQIITIYDFQGFNLRQHACPLCITSFLQWGQWEELYYPNLRKYLIWINVPKDALPLERLFKPILSETTIKTLKVFGPDKEEWSSFLKTIIPIDQLGIEYGGTRANLKFPPPQNKLEH